MSTRYLAGIVPVLFLMFLTGCRQGDSNIVRLSREKDRITVTGKNAEAVFTLHDGHLAQEYFSMNRGVAEKVTESFRAPLPFPSEAVQLYNPHLDTGHRIMVAENLTSMEVVENSNDRITISLKGLHGKDSLEQLVSLAGEDKHFHITVRAALQSEPVRLDYLLSAFTFNTEKIPSFIHTPGLKYDNDDSHQNRFDLLPGKDQVLGDRGYHSPAVILQEGGLFTALVPDLDAINEYAVGSPDARRTIDIGRNIFSVPFVPEKYTMPTGLDLNVKSGLTRKPLFAFGFMDNIIAHHIHYQRRNDTSMIRTLNSGNLRYEFDLFVGAQEVPSQGYKQIAQYQWERYGHRIFMNQPHLCMPFGEYFRIVDSITLHPSRYKDIDIPLKGYEDHGSWLQFDLDGRKAGGYRSAIEWWNDVMHNSPFWNNAREASGFWFWGKELDRPDLVDKAERIINLCLSAPRNEQGLFATLYNANTRTWGLQFSDPPHGKNEFFLRQSDSYDIPTMSKTAAHLVDYYLRCEKDERIIAYLKPYADWLVTAVDSSGAVPSYVTTGMVSSPLLLQSAQPSSSMWFLADYCIATGDRKYSEAAGKIAAYLEREILPGQKWIDMEQFYSCGARPVDFIKDFWQDQPARGTLSAIWACEGFARLFEATGDDRYLRDGESCIDYLSFYQCCWSPHYIYTAFPFGGFSVDNSDNATYLDARQAETVKPFIWYGKKLGRQDLLERGIAAARSSVVLQNLPEHKANDIYKYTNIYPYGLGPENIDHEAHPQSAMRTSPSWGEGSGVFTGLAEAYRELGGGYIDFAQDLKVGVNGIVIEKAELAGTTIKMLVRNSLSGLKMPWKKPYTIKLFFRGLKPGTYRVIINGTETGKLDTGGNSEFKYTVID